MKAAQFTAPGQVEVVDVPMPEERDGRILVRMEHAAICGSDLHTLLDSPAVAFPLIPGCSGHECVGCIVSATTGAAAATKTAWASDKDARVLVIPPNHDGFSEYLSIEPQHAIPVPDHLSFEEALLSQQLGTVLHCLKKLDSVIGATAVVVGQGPAGLLFTKLLARIGARRVIGLDVIDHRLEASRRMGATDAIHAGQVDAAEAVRELTGGAMADVVIEAVGETETINLCAELVRSKGTVALFGVPKRAAISFAYDAFFRKQAHLVFSVHAQSEADHWPFRLALDLVARRQVDLSPLITHRLPFARINEAFGLAHAKADGALKVVVNFDGPSSA